MKNHNFLFVPGFWLGEGKINISLSGEELNFYVRWSITRQEDLGPIECVQEIQVVGLSDIMHNKFLITLDPEYTMQIELTNQAIGSIGGKGLVDSDKIAWEFNRPDMGFAGFELYEKVDPNRYEMIAEYASSASADQFRTKIRGRIWRKES